MDNPDVATALRAVNLGSVEKVPLGQGFCFVVGGAAGGSVRKGDLLCTVDTHDDVLKYMGRFMQYYREHGKYLERSY